jgi:Domain of unknown function (DUF5658)
VNTLTLFVYLQLLDLLTTLAGIAHGRTEGNPIVSAAMTIGHEPVVNLILVKVVGVVVMLGVFRAHTWVFHGINWVFAAVVVWNVWVLM